MTVFAAFVIGMSIDRVSPFALIFDWHTGRRRDRGGREHLPALADEGRAIDGDRGRRRAREVGNLTILATFTVVAAI